jgi:hypothetical protein
MTRGLQIALLVALLGTATNVRAAAAVAVPVVAGSSFDDAPLLHAGTYNDTIVPQETLFYAVALGVGQRLRVDAEVDLSGGSKTEHGVAKAGGGFHLSFQTPLRDRLWADYGGDVFGTVSDFVRDGDSRIAPRVLSRTAADRRKIMDAEAWRGPGIYTFTAAISDVDGDVGASVEFPLKLRVTIDGPPPAGPVGPGPLGAVPAATTAGPDVARVERSRRRTPATDRAEPGAAISDLSVVIAAIVALLAGVGLGVGVSRVRPVSTR